MKICPCHPLVKIVGFQPTKQGSIPCWGTMITLKTFKNIIKAIKKQSDKEHKFCDALDEIIDGNFVPKMSTNILTALLDCLKDIFKDEGDWISWWLYERDGNKSMKAYNKDKTEIKLDTAEDLYKFLKQNKRV